MLANYSGYACVLDKVDWVLLLMAELHAQPIIASMKCAFLVTAVSMSRLYAQSSSTDSGSA